MLLALRLIKQKTQLRGRSGTKTSKSACPQLAPPFALQICNICRSDRGLVVRVTCVQMRLYILYYRYGGEHLSLYIHVIVCHIYIYSLPLCIQWFQFIYHMSTACLHFTCEADCAGGCGPVCAVAFYKCDVGNAVFLFLSAPQ